MTRFIVRPHPAGGYTVRATQPPPWFPADGLGRWTRRADAYQRARVLNTAHQLRRA